MNKFSNIYVFGDGLCDMGKWGKLTNYMYPPADLGFYESRWTNGKVWVEHLANQLNLSISFANNFAMGGATTGFYNINEPLRKLLKLDSEIKLQGMSAQIKEFIEIKLPIDDNSLFVLWAGGHDIGNYLEYGQPDLKDFPPSKNYDWAIEQLTKAGAKHIFVGTMPDMGFSPGYYGTDKQTIASNLCKELNDGLIVLKSKYENAGINFYLFDGAAVFAAIGMNPSKYGIKYLDSYLPFNVIDFMNPLMNTNISIINKEKGLNPDDFMNWWAVSASAKVHKIIAEEAWKFFNNTGK